MEETILNLYLIINNGTIEEFRAKSYKSVGNDDEKIKFLKSRSEEDYSIAKIFHSPTNRFGKKMTYKHFSKLEKAGKQFQLFEEVFEFYNVPAEPLVCLTPVVDGKIIQSG